MRARPQGIRLDGAVYSSDGREIGRIKRIFWSDGAVDPPEQEHGLLSITAADRPDEPDLGYLLVARPLAPDWYVPMDAIASAAGAQVTLKNTEQEAERFGWQEKPSGKL